MKLDLTNKTAFVPGGYGGIGAAVCEALARAGATVIVAGRHLDKARDLAARLPGAAAIAVDVDEVDSIRAAVGKAVREHGRIDFLINCVGIQREQPLLEVTESDFDAVYRSNLKAAMFMAQAVARTQIDDGRGGRHVHLLSVRAQLGLRGRGYSAYCATKGGLAMLVRQHASELGRHGILVNGVAPTVVRTEMGAHWLANPDTARWLQERIPLGRVAEPHECGGPVLFLCSELASFVSGQVLYVDGGLTASQ